MKKTMRYPLHRWNLITRCVVQKGAEFWIARSKRASPTRTRALTKRSKKDSQECTLKRVLLVIKRKRNKSLNFSGVHHRVNLNSNNNTARKHMLLQQNSKQHSKLKERNIKNTVLLDSDSNVKMICNGNHTEYVGC